MPVFRHEPISPRGDSAQAWRAHYAGDSAVKGVTLQTHELGKRLMATKKLAVSNEVHLRARLFRGQAEAVKVSQLPRGNLDGHA